MSENLKLMEVLFPILDILFDFWPFVLASALLGGLLDRRRPSLRGALVMWVALAVVRVVLVFNPAPIRTPLLIAEPLSTVLFLASGLVLLAAQIGWNLLRRRKLQQKAGRVNSVDDLLQLSPREFEEMVVELYRASGHKARRTGAIGDHGVDVVAQTPDGEKWVVQCKRWRGMAGEPIVRDFYGAMQHEKADKGAIITTGTFTPQAREWAHGKPIILYDGNELLEAWKRARSETAAQDASKPMVSPTAQPGLAHPMADTPSPPLCPKCGVPMVKRIATRGEHKGEPFYGCPNYPKCKEILPVQ
jgi:restriction system protein